jgi:DNA-binding CsgD family transcriptional regulator
MADQQTALIDGKRLAPVVPIADRLRASSATGARAGDLSPIEVRSRLLERAFDRLDVGVLLLDSSGRSFYRNARAARYFAENDGLSLDETGRPRAATLFAHRRLTDAILVACRTFRDPGADAVVPVSRRSTGRPWSIRVASLGDGSGSVALFIRDPADAAKGDAAECAKLFGLSEAEARVLARLVTGLSVAAVAESLGVSPNTVKTQLRSIFRKTGTTKQSDLVRLALSGA